MKLIHVSILIILLFFLAACDKEVNFKEHLAKIYSTAFGSMIDENNAANSNTNYIAVDMSHFSDLKEQDKQEILKYFEDKYKIKVMDASYEKLLQMDLYNPDTMVLDGVLLRIEKVDFVANDFLFEGSKYRAGTHAYGYKGIVHFKNGTWQIKESKQTWES
ncbi:peptide ABC transporter substrate-binding protein [Paenibacillus sp. RC67]|uniref:peptide ABC transporter substrate-binding protein n=1 Tax=Paenibacillus sp. RC67 TaxID=3039392 RepID=UPI0024AD1A87|nr:peptide ABC transporter substrate-binding protein [Paenibacillus sp. RC67]